MWCSSHNNTWLLTSIVKYQGYQHVGLPTDFRPIWWIWSRNRLRKQIRRDWISPRLGGWWGPRGSDTTVGRWLVWKERIYLFRVNRARHVQGWRRREVWYRLHLWCPKLEMMLSWTQCLQCWVFVRRFQLCLGHEVLNPNRSVKI
jgi:hypothetical protein